VSPRVIAQWLDHIRQILDTFFHASLPPLTFFDYLADFFREPEPQNSRGIPSDYGERWDVVRNDGPGGNDRPYADISAARCHDGPLSNPDIMSDFQRP
jgi:hypothetical protein